MKRVVLISVGIALIFLGVVGVKGFQSGRFSWSFWFQDGAFHGAGPVRFHPKSEEARLEAIECQEFDEQWEGRPVNNHNEYRMRESEFEVCREGMTRYLRNIDRGSQQ